MGGKPPSLGALHRGEAYWERLFLHSKPCLLAASDHSVTASIDRYLGSRRRSKNIACHCRE